MTRRAMTLALVACLGSACSSVDVHQHAAPGFEQLRAAGLRIAVMPFSVSAPEDGLLTASLASVGELYSLEAVAGAPGREGIGELLRRDLIAWLQQSEFEVLDPWFVGTVLTHAGVDRQQQLLPANAPHLAQLLDCDGVVFGDVTRWNRSYYVLQSNTEVAMRLELRDRGGNELFVTERSESIGAGLSGGPTGYQSLAAEPIAGLRGSHLQMLTRSVARHVATDLNGGDLGAHPGPMSPRLSVVALAKLHDGPFRAGERIEVVAVGTPDCAVRFDIGCLRTEVPMTETAVDQDARGERATYRGHYVVQAGDDAHELPLRCTIQRGAARRSIAYHYPWQGTVGVAGNGPREGGPGTADNP